MIQGRCHMEEVPCSREDGKEAREARNEAWEAMEKPGEARQYFSDGETSTTISVQTKI